MLGVLLFFFLSVFAFEKPGKTDETQNGRQPCGEVRWAVSIFDWFSARTTREVDRVDLCLLGYV